MTAIYNPLLDMFDTVAPTAVVNPWQVVSERIHNSIETAARKHNQVEAFKWLNVLDLIDSEGAAYWRETGLDLHNA